MSPMSRVARRIRKAWSGAVLIPAVAVGVAAFAVPGGAVFAEAPGKAVVTSQASLRWSDAGIPGVSTALVDGDMTKGASRFYLKYAAGFVAPVHHHSPDHDVTTVTGNLVLIVDGKEQRLAPGSYFAFTGKAKHSARCEGSTDCVMFVHAAGPWDVVPEK